MGAVLEVDGVSAGYGDLLAVRDVTLAVRRGEILAVLGRNGAGKSTALGVVAGLLRARSGHIRLDGRDVTGTAAFERTRLGIALVPQGRRLFTRRTVLENLRLGAIGLHRRDRRDAVDEALDRFPALAERPRVVAAALSGGQQQMLAIAQALVARPRVLLLDEPSAGLAPIVVDEVMRLVAALAGQGIGCVVVEQLVDHVLGVADTVTVLDGGRLVRSDPAADVDVGVLQQIYLGASVADVTATR